MKTQAQIMKNVEKKTIELRSLINKLDGNQIEDLTVVTEFLVRSTKAETKKFGLLLADPDKTALDAFVASLKLKKRGSSLLLQEVM